MYENVVPFMSLLIKKLLYVGLIFINYFFIAFNYFYYQITTIFINHQLKNKQ
jgi:hypothetical protein